MTEDTEVILATSKDFNELAQALAKAQGGFGNPKRNKTVRVRTKAGGTYTFSYADLAAVADVIRKPLSENGIAWTQVWNATGNRLETRLIHASGQWMSMTGPIMVDGAGPQEFGSGLTYQKRYQLSSITGVVADDDDDGNAAAGNEAEIVNNGGSHVKPKMGPNVLEPNLLEPSDPVSQTKAGGQHRMTEKSAETSQSDHLQSQADVTDWVAWSVNFKSHSESLSPASVDEYLNTQQDKLRDMQSQNPRLFARLTKAMDGVYPNGLILRQASEVSG